MAHN